MPSASTSTPRNGTTFFPAFAVPWILWRFRTDIAIITNWLFMSVNKELAALEEVTAEVSGKRVIFRSELRGCAGKVFQAAGVAAPPTVRFA